MVELLQQARVFILCRGRKPQGPAARGHDLDQLELAACQQVLAAWDDWLGVECVVGSVPLGQPQVLQLPFVTLRDLRLLHTTLVAARDTYRFPVNMPVVCAHRSDVAVAGMVPELLAMTCGSLSETLPVAAVLVVDAWEDIPRRLLRQGPSVLIGTLHRGKCQVLLHSTRKADDGLGIAVGGGGGGGGGAGGGVATGAGVAWNIVVPNSGSLLGASGTPRVPRVIGNPMFHHPILQAMSECHRQLGEYMDVTLQTHRRSIGPGPVDPPRTDLYRVPIRKHKGTSIAAAQEWCIHIVCHQHHRGAFCAVNGLEFHREHVHVRVVTGGLEHGIPWNRQKVCISFAIRQVHFRAIHETEPQRHAAVIHQRDTKQLVAEHAGAHVREHHGWAQESVDVPIRWREGRNVLGGGGAHKEVGVVIGRNGGARFESHGNGDGLHDEIFRRIPRNDAAGNESILLIDAAWNAVQQCKTVADA